jgi:transposase
VSGTSVRREGPSGTKLGVSTPNPTRRKKVPVETQAQYVGIDLHRRRSVIVRKDAAGETVETVHIVNDPVALAEVVGRAGEAPEVVLEACYGWYWAADVLAECGARVHLAHPLGNAWGNRRVKNDERDATDLIDLLRLGRLAEAYIAPRSQREVGELVRHRAKLVAVRSGLKAQVHAVLANQGVTVAAADLFGRAGRAELAGAPLDEVYRLRADSLLGVIDALGGEIDRFAGLVETALADHPGYRAIQAIPGVGPVLAAVFVAEIGDVSRFDNAARLSSWAGLTPRHRESDTHVVRGHITKQGSRLVRWAAVEAVGRQNGTSPVAVLRHRVAERRGRSIGRVAAARKLLTLVYYGLRDGEIRCLASEQ